MTTIIITRRFISKITNSEKKSMRYTPNEENSVPFLKSLKQYNIIGKIAFISYKMWLLCWKVREI